jgi:putative hydrolase of the HAD superfamily
VIRAVTFDFWETLIRERQGHMRTLHVDGWMRELAAAGTPRDRAAVEAAFSASWEVFNRRWMDNRGQYGSADATTYMCEHLGMERDDDLQAQLVDVFRQVGETVDLELAPGIGECLEALRAAGLGVGIVCDAGMTAGAELRGQLARHGVLAAFDAWSFSDETGWFKPARQAFEPALRGLGIDDPSQVAHVGDNRRTDVAGALGMGMLAVRYTGFRDPPPGDGPEASIVLEDHRDLAAALGI